MKQSYDIVIVGSGIGGLSSLLYLSETSIYKEGNLSICLLVKGALNQNQLGSRWNSSRKIVRR